MGFGDASAKDKKALKSASADAASKKAEEEANWDDNDKALKGKAARASAKDDKADAKLAAKKERQELEAAEEAGNAKLSGAGKKAQAPTKVTQAEIARRQALLAMSKPAAKKSAKAEVVSQPKLEANTNRAADVEVTGIDAALGALGGSEKKTRMNYKEYEAKMLPEVQAENPDLKLSQAKDKVAKMWDRAPENPKNQEK